jgi:hypothetical protein
MGFIAGFEFFKSKKDYSITHPFATSPLAVIGKAATMVKQRTRKRSASKIDRICGAVLVQLI